MKPLLPFAKRLRNQPTDTERFLWKALRRNQLGGFKFRRQVPIGPFIVDFACLERKVVIELDGSQHLQQEEDDQIRDRWLTKEGYRVLRFWDGDVFKDNKGVLETIWQACQDHPPPHPLPSREGGNYLKTTSKR